MTILISDLEYADEILDLMEKGSDFRWRLEQKMKQIRAQILADSEAFRARAAELIGEEHVDKAGNFP